MASALSLLLAIFKAIPILKEIWDGLMSAYISSQIDNMKKENRDAIKKAITGHDQRDLERLISTNPGEASNLPGTRERPPRVRESE